MKTPPLLLGATLVFWGWQTDFLLAGVVMAAVLESTRFTASRWELSDEDFNRIRTFCLVLLLAAVAYMFNSNTGRSQFTRLFQNPNPGNQNDTGIAAARTVTALFRWLPMIFFPFMAAQSYSSRQEIPLALFLRWRWRKDEKNGVLPPSRGVDVSFPYFSLCLFAASNHASESSDYFWGLCVLLAWALWPQRSRRFGIAVWLTVFGLAVGLGYISQRNIGRLQNYLSNLNPQMFAQFLRHRVDPMRNRTALGQIGRLKQSGRIVVWLQPGAGPVPAYLREASYRIFDSPVWSMGRARDPFQGFNPETNGTTWLLLPSKTNTARLNIACYLEGQRRDGEPVSLLPVPAGSGRLENMPGYTLLSTNTAGAILAEGPGFVIFDACFGPGKSIDSPPRRIDTEGIPEAEKPALDQIISRLQIEGKSLDETLKAINRLFQSEFTYSVWQSHPEMALTNETPLTRFLLRTHSGHCEYFATATVLLLRSLGIPARYAVGYAVHEPSGTGYVVRQRDAHAWCLVWNPETETWQDFDTTPASWVAEEGKGASPWQKLSDLWSWIGFHFSKLRWGDTNLRQYLFYLLLPVLALLLYQILFRRQRRRKQRDLADAGLPAVWPGLDSEFYLIERKLIEHGISRRGNELLSNWLERATRESPLARMKEPLRELLQLHYRCRFDPLGLDPANRERLKRGTTAALTTLEP